MSKLILQPAGNPDANEHYNDTIKTPVNLEKISKYLSIEDHDTLKKIYPDNKYYIWGVTPKSSNITQWNKISDNDIALFARNNMIFSYGTSCYKMISHDLAAYLWEYDKDGFTWEYIYFLKNITPLSYTYLEMNQAIGYKPKYNYRGFNVVDSERSANAINLLGINIDFLEEIDQRSPDTYDEEVFGTPPIKYGSGGESERHKNLKLYIRDNPEVIEIENVVNRKDERYYPTGDHVDVWFEDSHGKKYVVEIELEGDENLLVGAKQLIKYRSLEAVENGWFEKDSRVKAILVAYNYDGNKTEKFCSKYDIAIFQVDKKDID